MRKQNHQEETINYREPFGSSFRGRRRKFTGVNYNDRSPEAAAMNAHLRASAYSEENRSSARVADQVDRENGVAAKRPRAFFKLLRELQQPSTGQLRDGRNALHDHHSRRPGMACHPYRQSSAPVSTSLPAYLSESANKCA